MSVSTVVSHIEFRPASELDRCGGLLGWVTFRFRGLHIDGSYVRRTRAGRVVFFWANHEACTGRRHVIVQPVDRELRVALEQYVLGELRRRGLIR